MTNMNEEIKKRILETLNSYKRSPNIKKLAQFIKDNSNHDVNCIRYRKRNKYGSKKIRYGYLLEVRNRNNIIFTHDTINYYGDTLLSVCLFIKREILDKQKGE